MIKLFKNVNGVFISEDMLILDHFAENKQLLVDVCRVVSFKSVKIANKYLLLSMRLRKIHIKYDIINRFIIDIKNRWGRSVKKDKIVVRRDGPITTVTNDEVSISYTFCPELEKVVAFDYKLK